MLSWLSFWFYSSSNPYLDVDFGLFLTKLMHVGDLTTYCVCILKRSTAQNGSRFEFLQGKFRLVLVSLMFLFEVHLLVKSILIVGNAMHLGCSICPTPARKLKIYNQLHLAVSKSTLNLPILGPIDIHISTCHSSKIRPVFPSCRHIMRVECGLFLTF